MKEGFWVPAYTGMTDQGVVDRAFEELSSSSTLPGKPAVAPFGEMVARRPAPKRFDMWASKR